VPKIGRYEVEHEIGRGAGGAVFLANDPRLRRPVAVKVIRLPDGLTPAEQREFRARFAREAQATAGLSHPGIVTVHDAGEDETSGDPYLAMEYVAGRTLREVLDAEGRMPPDRAVALVGRVADALHAAHLQGIVHRDVKPANLLVRDADGAIKVVDFGIARLGGSALTRTDLTLGSPAYMSPEQVRGAPVDGRSDLFSLASILYEALTGSRPFAGDEIPAVLYSIAHTDPTPPSQHVPGLPPALDAFFEIALAKERDERFPTGDAFRAALDGALGGKSPTTVAARVASAPPIEPIAALPRRGARRRWILAASALLALASVALHLSSRRAWLRLEAKSSVREASLQVLVDGREVFERALSAPQKKPGALARWIAPSHETFETWIRMPPGKHEIAAVVTPNGDGAPYRDSIVVDVAPREKRRLRLVAGRSLGAPVSLKLD